MHCNLSLWFKCLRVEVLSGRWWSAEWESDWCWSQNQSYPQNTNFSSLFPLPLSCFTALPLHLKYQLVMESFWSLHSIEDDLTIPFDNSKFDCYQFHVNIWKACNNNDASIRSPVTFWWSLKENSLACKLLLSVEVNFSGEFIYTNL